MSEEVSEADVTEDDEETLAKAGQLLCSNGQAEATAYATAELKDSLRPTMEMERVQLNDPRDRITQPSSRPSAAIDSTARLPEGMRAPPSPGGLAPLPSEPVVTAPLPSAPPPSARAVPPPFPGAPTPPAPAVAYNSPSDAPTVAKGPPLVPSSRPARSSGRGLTATAAIAAVLLAGVGLRFTLARGAAPPPPTPAAIAPAAVPDRAPEPVAAQPPPPAPPPAAAAPPEPAATQAPAPTAVPVAAQETPKPVAETPKPVEEPVKAAARAPAPTVKPRAAAPVVPAVAPVAPPVAKPAATSHRVFGSED